MTSQPVDFAARIDRFRRREATIGIVGMGYVGLPLALAACEAGFPVIGFDRDAPKVELLNAGESYIKHVEARRIAEARRAGRLTATAAIADLTAADAILICVPTPLDAHREPDLSYVVGTSEALVPCLRPGHLVVLESTTYPGTTTGVMKPILERSGLVAGRDLFLAYSPEREDPGNSRFQTASIPKIVGGDGPDALALAETLYAQIVERVVPVGTTETAEAVKLTENIFRAVNIALVNELKVVYDAMGIDVWQVIDAAATKPFGYMPFYPGPGLGGHCIPIDPFYLTWKAREFEIATRFIELAGEVNSAMPGYVVERLARALDAATGRGLNGARLLVVGLAYKKNVDDTRESPALRIIELLERRGAVVGYHDPFVPLVPPTRKHGALEGRASVALTPETLRGFDAALIVTDHDGVDYGALVAHCRLVVDTRNACARAGLSGDHIVKA
jgi:UDP-N-acetyl-D-glucosamine dehydrogenase